MVVVLVVSALPEEGEAARLQLEVVRVVQPPHEIVELVRRDVGDLAAPVADQVLVGLREVEERRALATSDLLDHSPFLQRFERPVHGRRRDRRVRHLQPTGNVVDREVLACGRKQLDQSPARRRDALASRTDLLQDPC